jgi:hypothetical protein
MSACSQKFYKLKRESDKLLADGGAVAASSDVATPVKATKTPGSKGTSGRKRKSAGADCDREIATPTKRSKLKKNPAPEVEVKAEVQDEDTPAVKVADRDAE